MNADALKKQVCDTIDAMRGDLLSVSHYIHANPELAFEEFKAAERLTAEVKRAGLTVQSAAFGCDTAFASEFGKTGAPRFAILSEYDALPGIGHSCGHNIIATAGLGAALALAKLGGALPGAVRYLGTPAEERGGGKEVMAQSGAFEGVDAAMMVHPSGLDILTMPCLAIAEVEAIYNGRSAHASAMPHRGINALDAVILAYQSIAALRQHIKPTERIHGIVTEGGQAPNIVPDRAAARFYVRAAGMRELQALKKRVQGCFEAGALATGAELDARWSPVDYTDLKTNWPLATRYRANAELLGREFVEHTSLPPGFSGSTDMGNVSHRVPSIHPMIASAPPNVVIHNPEFARWAASEKGDRAALDGAKAMAMTAIDFFADATLREAARSDFDATADESRDAIAQAFHRKGEMSLAGCACC